MRQFEVRIKNEVGSLARLSEILAKGNVNIRGIATEVKPEGVGKVKMVVDNEEMAREIMKVAGVDFHEHEIVEVELIDRPGEFAKITKAIANMGINIGSVFILAPTDKTVKIAFRVDDLAKAKEVLRDLGLD